MGQRPSQQSSSFFLAWLQNALRHVRNDLFGLFENGLLEMRVALQRFLADSYYGAECFLCSESLQSALRRVADGFPRHFADQFFEDAAQATSASRCCFLCSSSIDARSHVHYLGIVARRSVRSDFLI